LPACDARIVHVPTATSATLLPLTVHTDTVVDEKLTARPDDAVALSAKLRTVVAKILEAETLALDLLMHCGRDADAAGLGERFKPRRNVQAGAVYVPSPVMISPRLMPMRTCRRRPGCAAALRWAISGMSRALCTASVTVENSIKSPSPVVLTIIGNLGIDQLVADGAQLREHARLIGLDKPRVADDIRCNDDGEPTRKHVAKILSLCGSNSGKKHRKPRRVRKSQAANLCVPIWVSRGYHL